MSLVPSYVMFDPPIPMILIVGLGIVAAVVIIAGYVRAAPGVRRWKKALLTGIRLCALAAILVILMRPMALTPVEEDLKRPVFYVLADCSGSMKTEDVDDKSRYNAMVEALTGKKGDFLDELNLDYDVRFYGFGGNLWRTSLADLANADRIEEKETHISTALMKAVQGEDGSSGSCMLLISDGRSNEVDSQNNIRSVSRHLRGMKMPVWTAGVGSTAEKKDVYLTARMSSSFVFIDQPTSIHVAVTGTGYANWYVRVNLFREDEYVTSEQLYLRNGHAATSFPIREPIKGSYRYRVEVEPLTGENDVYNNKRSVIAKVMDEKTKVLVLEAGPHWDSKFLLRTLRSDSNVEVTSIFHINDYKSFAIVGGEASEPGIKMPTTKEELFKYDCIFLGQDIDKIFSSRQLGLFESYLSERGGSIVFYRGKSYTYLDTPLEKLEPVTWGQEYVNDVKLELTGAGRENPIFDYRPHVRESDVIVNELPAMKSIARIQGAKSLAVVLARGADGGDDKEIATVVYQRYGKGKVMSIGASGLWQWGFLPGELQDYDDIYLRFWGQMVRWLVSDSSFLPGQDITFLMDRNNYAPGETVQMSVNAKFLDYSSYKPRIDITSPDGRTISLNPEQSEDNKTFYATSFKPNAEGEYVAKLYNNIGKPEEEELRFTVYQDLLEMRYVSADREMLDQISSVTGGETLELDQLDKLPEQVKNFERLSCNRVKPHDIWDRASVFSILVGALGLEWLLRRSSGLV